MTNYYWTIFAALLAIFLISCKGEVRESEETEVMAIDNAAIQGAMNSYIQQKLEVLGGTYPINEVEAEFDSLHEGVNEMQGLYVSCADFKAGEDVYDIDLYVKAEDGKYTVVKEVLHKKNGELVNEALWQGQ